MYGAILGDIIGSVYEWHNIKTKDFPLLIRESRYTDDSAMTIAVAEALLDTLRKDRAARRDAVIRSMQKWGRRYPHAGYGGKFRQWLRDPHPHPYNSWGNGSAMRVSSAGWLFDSLEETLKAAEDKEIKLGTVSQVGGAGLKATAAVGQQVFSVQQLATQAPNGLFTSTTNAAALTHFSDGTLSTMVHGKGGIVANYGFEQVKGLSNFDVFCEGVQMTSLGI